MPHLDQSFARCLWRLRPRVQSAGAASESLTVHAQKAGNSFATAGTSNGPMLVSGGVMAQLTPHA